MTAMTVDRLTITRYLTAGIVMRFCRSGTQGNVKVGNPYKGSITGASGWPA